MIIQFLKEVDRKLIVAFKENEIERSQSLVLELKHAIRNSRIAVVVFTKNYASSSWSFHELVEIVKCKKEFGQLLIPVFYRFDPSHVWKQTEDFGKIFEKTCRNRTEDEKIRWRGALTDVANIFGCHMVTWYDFIHHYLSWRCCLSDIPSLVKLPSSFQNIHPHDCEGNTRNSVNLGGHATQQNQECGDSGVKRKSSRTKLQVIMMGRTLKKLLSCYAANPQDT